MKHLLPIISVILLCVCTVSGQEITGKWYGKTTFGSGASLRIVVDIRPSSDGGYTATLQSPDQSDRAIPADSVFYIGNTLTLKIPAIRFTYEGTVLGSDSIVGVVKQNGEWKTDLSRKPIPKTVLNRPQEPGPPFPYLSEDIAFDSPAAGVRLSGTVTIPRGDGPYPAVVLLQGSGNHNRDEEVFGHKPFLVLADYLTRRGIAVLRYDERGVGKSGGEPANSSLGTLADDACAARDYLRTRPEIDPGRIGLVGHSEGGQVSFISAARGGDIPFIVTLASPGVTSGDIMLMQNETSLRGRGLAAAFAEPILETVRKMIKLVKVSSDKATFAEAMTELLSGTAFAPMLDKQIEDFWAMRESILYDPAESYKYIKCPVLALNGAKDWQVRSEVNLRAIEDGIRANGNQDITIKEYPGLNHLFQTAGTGLMEEYGEIEETFSPEAMQDIVDWILAKCAN